MVTVTSRAHGPDMSKYDLSFDPAKATHQLDFAIQRASYRTTPDQLFAELNVGVQKVPIRLAYHYLNSDASWVLQYDTFMKTVADKNFHAFVCDFERPFNTMSVAFAKSAWDFCKQVVIDTGKRCLIYTNKYEYQDWLVPSQVKYGINWNLVDFWIAQYWNSPNPDAQPLLPAGRTAGWNLWQYTSNGGGTKYGMGRPVEGDLNVFNGTVDEMKKWLGITDPTPEPTPTNPVVSFSLEFGGKTWEAVNVEMTPKV